MRRRQLLKLIGGVIAGALLASTGVNRQFVMMYMSALSEGRFMFGPLRGDGCRPNDSELLAGIDLRWTVTEFGRTQ